MKSKSFRTLIMLAFALSAANVRAQTPKPKTLERVGFFVGVANVPPFDKPFRRNAYSLEFNEVWSIKQKWSAQLGLIVPVGSGSSRPFVRAAIARRLF